MSYHVEINIFNRKSASKTGGVEFKISGHLGDMLGLMKNAIELHYRKCKIQHFWSLTVLLLSISCESL